MRLLIARPAVDQTEVDTGTTPSIILVFLLDGLSQNIHETDLVNASTTIVLRLKYLCISSRDQGSVAQ